MKLQRVKSLVVVWVVAVCSLAAPAVAQGVETSAGPIWSNSDARTKCPAVCSRKNMGWQGVWHTAQFGRDSVCNCIGAADSERRSSPDAFAVRSANRSASACSVGSVRQCRGCSVSCADGKSAYCQAGDVGIFNGPNDRICSREARCECR